MTTLLFIHVHYVRVASSCQSERRDHITHPPASSCLSHTHMHTQSAVISQCWHRVLLPPGFRRRADSIFLHKTVISFPHHHRQPLPSTPDTPFHPLTSPLFSSHLTLRLSFLTSPFSLSPLRLFATLSSWYFPRVCCQNCPEIRGVVATAAVSFPSHFLSTEVWNFSV